MTVFELQREIFEEITNPENEINLQIIAGRITRDDLLEKYKNRCLEEDISEEETDDLIELIDRSVFGYGLIHDMLVDEPDISDIRLIDENRIMYKKNGERYQSPMRFASKESYLRFIESVTERNKTALSYASAAQIFVDTVQCPTHILRFTVESEIINQTNLPSIVIRKIAKETPSWDELIQKGLFTEDQKHILTKLWKNGFSILICGPNGSGKTTVANKLLNAATPRNKSCCVIQESDGEIHADPEKLPEMVFKKIVLPTPNSKISYDLKTITQLALTESFDIIVVGEVKGGEAAQLANAVWTGSQSMTTTHSNSVYDGKRRLVQLACDENPNRSPEFFMEQLDGFRVTVYVENYKITEINVDNEPFNWDKFNNGDYGKPRVLPKH